MDFLKSRLDVVRVSAFCMTKKNVVANQFTKKMTSTTIPSAENLEKQMLDLLKSRFPMEEAINFNVQDYLQHVTIEYNRMCKYLTHAKVKDYQAQFDIVIEKFLVASSKTISYKSPLFTLFQSVTSNVTTVVDAFAPRCMLVGATSLVQKYASYVFQAEPATDSALGKGIKEYKLPDELAFANLYLLHDASEGKTNLECDIVILVETDVVNIINKLDKAESKQYTWEGSIEFFATIIQANLRHEWMRNVMLQLFGDFICIASAGNQFAIQSFCASFDTAMEAKKSAAKYAQICKEADEKYDGCSLQWKDMHTMRQLHLYKMETCEVCPFFIPSLPNQSGDILVQAYESIKEDYDHYKTLDAYISFGFGKNLGITNINVDISSPINYAYMHNKEPIVYRCLNITFPFSKDELFLLMY